MVVKAKLPVRAPRPSVVAGGPKIKNVAAAVLRGAIAAERAMTGDPMTSLGGASLRQVIGVPIPLAMEWLIGANMFPLSKLIQIVGKTGSNKSSLGFEIMRWLSQLDGFGMLFDVENKYNALLAASFLGYPQNESEEVLGVIPCHSCTDWQTKLLRRTELFIDTMLKKSKNNPKPCGDVFPIGLMVDSVVARLTEKAQDNVLERGYGDKKFADEAMSVTYFLKTYMSKLASMPFMLILINHLKLQKIEGTFAVEHKKGGGELIGFQEIIELELTKRRAFELCATQDDEALDKGGNTIRIACTKNSFGATGREVEVDLVWSRKTVEGEVRQLSRWNWGATLIDILQGYKQARAKRKIAELVDINGDPDKGKYWSKRFKQTKETAVDKATLGNLISRDKTLKRALRRLLGIREYAVIKPGISFAKQLKELGSRQAKEINAE